MAVEICLGFLARPALKRHSAAFVWLQLSEQHVEARIILLLAYVGTM